jgi:type I restriction enzyme, S subunit
LTYVSSSDSARRTKRLDPEFFAPRIRDLIARLGTFGGKIGDVAPSRHEKFNASAPGSFDYIEISDLGGDGTVSSTSLDRAEAPSRATWHVRAGDVITSTVRPIRRLSALIEPSQDGFVCSSGFVVLQPERVTPEVLLTYLRLPLICELMDLHTSASMYPAISETDLLALPFAPPDDKTARAIRDEVTRCRAARSRAAALLDAAKRTVEIAIEQDEAAAMRFLDSAEA